MAYLYPPRRQPVSRRPVALLPAVPAGALAVARPATPATGLTAARRAAHGEFVLAAPAAAPGHGYTVDVARPPGSRPPDTLTTGRDSALKPPARNTEPPGDWNEKPPG